uniref:Uncharacterized protein n=1 Tax=Vibrio sp. FF_307 TaxID=1652834 RepID=A0A0H4A325_9VIBR|nr:hypothetical protein [Vibrio sp. FF_307]
MAEALSQALRCVHRIMAITSAFQADDAGTRCTLQLML